MIEFMNPHLKILKNVLKHFAELKSFKNSKTISNTVSIILLC